MFLVNCRSPILQLILLTQIRIIIVLLTTMTTWRRTTTGINNPPACLLLFDCHRQPSIHSFIHHRTSNTEPIQIQLPTDWQPTKQPPVQLIPGIETNLNYCDRWTVSWPVGFVHWIVVIGGNIEKSYVVMTESWYLKIELKEILWIKTIKTLICIIIWIIDESLHFIVLF